MGTCTHYTINCKTVNAHYKSILRSMAIIDCKSRSIKQKQVMGLKKVDVAETFPEEQKSIDCVIIETVEHSASAQF